MKKLVIKTETKKEKAIYKALNNILNIDQGYIEKWNKHFEVWKDKPGTVEYKKLQEDYWKITGAITALSELWEKAREEIYETIEEEEGIF